MAVVQWRECVGDNRQTVRVRATSLKVWESFELDAATFLVEFWGLTEPLPPGMDPNDFEAASYVDEVLLTECNVIEAWTWAQDHLEPGETYALYLPIALTKGYAAIDETAAMAGNRSEHVGKGRVGRIRLLGQDQAGPGRFFHRPWDEPPSEPVQKPPRPSVHKSGGRRARRA